MICSAHDTLEQLRQNIRPPASELLLPAAERAVTALHDLQDGFFMGRQPSTDDLTLTHADGRTEQLSLARATAQYIDVLRNATHGHGERKAQRAERVNALLVHHNGVIPTDLGLLGYLYLLDVLTDPDKLRDRLHNNGKI